MHKKGQFARIFQISRQKNRSAAPPERERLLMPPIGGFRAAAPTATIFYREIRISRAEKNARVLKIK